MKECGGGGGGVGVMEMEGSYVFEVGLISKKASGLWTLE